MSDNHIKAHDDAVRADERVKLAKIHERIRDLLNKADILLIDIMSKTGQATNGTAPQVKAKRKSVTADPVSVFAVFDTLKAATEPLTIKNVAQATNLGPKIIGAALRACITSGSVIEQPKGKFRAVAQPAAADGAGE